MSSEELRTVLGLVVFYQEVSFDISETIALKFYALKQNH